MFHGRTEFNHRWPALLLGAGWLVACDSNEEGSPAGGANHTVNDTGPSTEVAASLPETSELDHYVSTALQRFAVPGAAVALLRDGEVVYEGVFGVRDRESQAPVARDTLFMLGSLNKSMTSMMMASLVDTGELSWDRPVLELLPSFALSNPESTPQIRVRDLVNHSSGVAQLDTPFYVELQPPLAMIASIAQIPTLATPGEVYNYSNQMYATGGYVAAIAAGTPVTDEDLSRGYERLMQERVFDPVGMPQTTFDFDAALTREHALPHAYDGTLGRVSSVPIRFERAVLSVAPAGAVWSTLADVERYVVSQMGGVAPGGARVVSPEALLETQTGNILIEEGLRYGMGWVVGEYLGRKTLGHDGGTLGFRTTLALLPDDAIGVAILTNHGGAVNFYGAVTRHLLETALGLPHGDDTVFDEQEQATLAAIDELMAQTTTADPAEVASYLGCYERGVQVEADAGGLLLHTQLGTIPLAEVGTPDSFVGTGTFAGGVAVVFDASRPDAPALSIGSLGAAELSEPVTVSRVGAPPCAGR